MAASVLPRFSSRSVSAAPPSPPASSSRSLLLAIVTCAAVPRLFASASSAPPLPRPLSPLLLSLLASGAASHASRPPAFAGSPASRSSCPSASLAPLASSTRLAYLFPRSFSAFSSPACARLASAAASSRDARSDASLGERPREASAVARAAKAATRASRAATAARAAAQSLAPPAAAGRRPGIAASAESARQFSSLFSTQSLSAETETVEGRAERAPRCEKDAQPCGGGDRRYSPVESGCEGEKSFSLVLSDRETGKRLSPWHGVPLFAGREGENLFNMVVEIPKNSRKKMEIQLDRPLTPIMQDVKKDGSLREYASTMYWNYGAFPQTWEDPRAPGDPEVFHALGDGDPLDAVEIGSQVLRLGDVVSVKVLGALAMIDKGELDWKVLAIREGDPLFSQLHSIEDVARLCPGVVSGVREWFRWYKLPTDNVLNTFGHNEEALGASEALQVVRRAHEHYRRLIEDGERARRRRGGGDETDAGALPPAKGYAVTIEGKQTLWLPLDE
ncbi:type I inorganic pyrophosphatase PPase [Besnoitia besnoiti]|uniref:inorganic diphosphatase n=1 Tax=Besnoitia besnoiti TaxID=94643 RepID=A0A2A9MDF7_BESBE|nr:type I inorganic pyrophosphatase PPase [Besnoitia besnoiti]PFH33402.1 type I inorganic pyrophosphatase PPase [Besnoitia besnoiti]